MASRGRTVDYKRWDSLLALRQAFATVGTRFASGSIPFTESATILRCRLTDCLVFLDNTQQAGDQMSVIFGLGIVSTDAFVAGAGSVPDPGGEPEYPWLWWGRYSLEGDVAASSPGLGTNVVRFSADTKAMRRIRPGQSLVWIVEASAVAGAPNTIVSMGQTRVLIGT